MLVTTKKILLDAKRGGYGVGAFNTSDLEITKAIIAAAVKLNSPVIVQVSGKAIAYAGLENIADIIKNEAKKAPVPVALHLDHGADLKIVSDCIEEGFTSVMFDGSHLTLLENEILTAKAAEMAHRAKIVCEGELGCIGNSKNEAEFTDAKLVRDFVKKTKVDSLAVSIGSRHGTKIQNLNIDLLKIIRQKTDIPLVLHGASGIPDEEVKKAIKYGICKVNIDTDIRHTFSDVIHNINKKYASLSDPREIMQKVMVEIQKVVEEKIKLFGSENKG
ncbi:MAG: class II fructose-bisphosphate aldolase [Candidatus Berkelbacteria bacterium]